MGGPGSGRKKGSTNKSSIKVKKNSSKATPKNVSWGMKILTKDSKKK